MVKQPFFSCYTYLLLTFSCSHRRHHEFTFWPAETNSQCTVSLDVTVLLTLLFVLSSLLGLGDPGLFHWCDCLWYLLLCLQVISINSAVIISYDSGQEGFILRPRALTHHCSIWSSMSNLGTNVTAVWLMPGLYEHFLVYSKTSFHRFTKLSYGQMSILMGEPLNICDIFSTSVGQGPCCVMSSTDVQSASIHLCRINTLVLFALEIAEQTLAGSLPVFCCSL